jgi:hypothetical protein
MSEEPVGDTYGADSLEALQLAADTEPILKILSERYDFYFPTGEGYFDEYLHREAVVGNMQLGSKPVVHADRDKSGRLTDSP